MDIGLHGTGRSTSTICRLGAGRSTSVAADAGEQCSVRNHRRIRPPIKVCAVTIEWTLRSE